MPRKTDSNNAADWLFFVESDLALLRVAGEREIGFEMACSKLAECLEKLIKAELIRQGWALMKTHDLLLLAEELDARHSDLLPAVLPLAHDLAEKYLPTVTPASISTTRIGPPTGGSSQKSRPSALKSKAACRPLAKTLREQPDP